MAVDYERPDYMDALPNWQMVDQCAEERDLGDLLIENNALDQSPQNRQRNREYRERASWFGATAFTEAGLIGTAFGDVPEIELPAPLEDLRTNCDGGGIDLQQQMQRTLAQVLRKGRCGLLVSYPAGGEASIAEKQAGYKRATIQRIDAERIINWWTTQRGAKSQLGGVVFRDRIEAVVDFELTVTPTIRSIVLDATGAVDSTWVEKDGKWVLYDEPKPIMDGKGAPWQELPFSFVGAFDNAATIDRAPLLSLARLNVDHFRNSADFEEATYFSGTPQPWVSGWHQEDADAARDGGFYLGSRQVIVCEHFAFAQADPNPMARQGMLDKQDRMKAIGARLLEPGGVAKTAQQDASEQRGQHSVLSLAVANVEDAYNAALRWCAVFEGSAEGFVSIPREYMKAGAAMETVDAMLAAWDRGLVGPNDALRVLKSADFIDEDKTLEEYSDELSERGALAQGPVVDAE